MTGPLEARLRRIEARRTCIVQGVEVVFVPDPAPADWPSFEAEHAARAPDRHIIFIEFIDPVPQP